MSADVEPLPRVFVSLSEAALMLSISKTTAYRMADADELPTVNIGARRLVPVAALEELADRVIAEHRAKLAELEEQRGAAS